MMSQRGEGEMKRGGKKGEFGKRMRREDDSYEGTNPTPSSYRTWNRKEGERKGSGEKGGGRENLRGRR